LQVLGDPILAKKTLIDALEKDAVSIDNLRSLNINKSYNKKAVWVARLTRDQLISVSCEFEPHQRRPLFH